MRINRYLAIQGYATRRGADELIEQGKVFINGRKAVLGDQVEETDTVEVKTGKRPKSYTYLAYHKPRSIITHSPGEDETDIISALKGDIPDGLFPIGRLDKDSSGLIILTNDGRITDRLLNPDYEHEKEYRVTTVRPLRESFKKYMEAGVDIEGYMTKPTKVRVMGENVFAITLTEGKKHQIRRMVSALHNEVKTLQRTRIENIELGKLPSGKWRPIEGEELSQFMDILGLA
jgi:23S rRNA pseudouridine2604 synthase